MELTSYFIVLVEPTEAKPEKMAEPPQPESLIITNILRTYKVLKFFGFASFSIENRKLVTKPRDLFFLLLSFSTGITFIVTSIQNRSELGTARDHIADVGNFLTYISSLVIALISMSISFIFRHKTWQNILKMAAIDDMMKKIDFYVDYNHIATRTRWIASFLILWSVPLNIFIYHIEKSMLKAFLYWYSGTYFILSFGTAVGVLNGSYIRFKSINSMFEYFFEGSDNVKVVKSELIDTKRIVAVGIEAYGELMDVYESINVYNGMQAFLGVGLLYFYTIFTSFMVFKDWSVNGYLSNITIGSVVYGCYLHIFTASLIYVCHIVEEQPKKTLRMINSLISGSKNENDVALLTSFGSLIKIRSPKFSCGLFDFDLSLVYGVSWLDNS